MAYHPLPFLINPGNLFANDWFLKGPWKHLPYRQKRISLFIPTRKPIRIDLSTTNTSSQPLSGNLSMSVFMIDSLQHIPEQSIITYLYLHSELKGRIESPEYYFDNTDKVI